MERGLTEALAVCVSIYMLMSRGMPSYTVAYVILNFPPTVTSSKPPLGLQPKHKFNLPALHITSSESSDTLKPQLLQSSTSAVELRAPGAVTRTRDSAVSTDSGLGGEFPSRDSVQVVTAVLGGLGDSVLLVSLSLLGEQDSFCK